MHASRRHFLTGVGACAACMASRANAVVLPTDLTPLIDASYEPVDADERGMWQSCERIEEMIRTSPLRMDAPGLHDYTRGVVERLLGRPAPSLRIYLMRDSSFNASMYPTGMMIVNTGLMARARNEAQYAAVLGHESGHFFRKHTITNYRSVRRKGAAMAFIGVVGGAAGGGWVDAANVINQALVMSVFQFSRGLESEADAFGLMLMARAGYSPGAASQMWEQLIAERKASAEQRHAKYKDKSNSTYSTHPPTEDRMEDLDDTAAHLARTGETKDFEGRAEWLAATQPYRAMLLEEQVSLNDAGASLYLLENHAQDGWDGTLRYYEGEVFRLRGGEGDDEKAANSYAVATSLPAAPAESWRNHGYALIKAGKVPEGREALNRYLTMKPDAKDAGIVRFTLNN